MTMELRGGMFVAGAILLAAVMLLYAGGANRDEEEKIRSRCTQKTAGVIDHLERGFHFTGYKMNRHRACHYMYGPAFTLVWSTIYTYNVGGTAYSGIDARIPLAFFKPGNSGDEVVLFYNPNNAEEFCCPGEDVNAKYGFGIVFGLIALAAGLCYMIFRILA